MKDLGSLQATMRHMRELNVHPSHVTLGILVKAFGQAGEAQRVLEVWDAMAEQRQQANAVTFGCMIDACVRCGHMGKAVEIFLDMKQRRKHRNTILYTTLIKGYGLEKDLQNAITLFREMRDEGVPYNTVTYNSIMDVCVRCGDLQVAEEIKNSGLRCDELVYNTLMDGCVKGNDLSAGIGLFAEMRHAGVVPSSITHSILVRLYQRNGYKGDAFDAVAQLYEHHGLPRPSPALERGSRGGSRRGGDKKRNRKDKGVADRRKDGSGKKGIDIQPQQQQQLQ